MATTLHSFMDIFDTTFGEGQDAVQLKRLLFQLFKEITLRGEKARM